MNGLHREKTPNPSYHDKEELEERRANTGHWLNLAFERKLADSEMATSGR